MTDQITLQQALELVEFQRNTAGFWYVDTVKGNCNAVQGDLDSVGGDCGIIGGDCDRVKGSCGTVEGSCNIIEGSCDKVRGDCGIVKGNCGTVEGDCITVKGHVYRLINGREWQYVETPDEKFRRLLNESGNQELIDTFNQLKDN